MHVQPISTFRLFQEGHLLRNSIAIFVLTTLFYFIGAELRLVHELSLFWPLNGVMAGVFARYVWLNRLHYYAISYVAMLVYDAITTEWGLVSLAINFSNMMFIVTVALLVARDKSLGKNKYEPVSALRLFNYCLLAALLCAIVGAIGSVSIDSLDFWPLLADWFSEQFSTGVLIVPCMLTLAIPGVLPRFKAEQMMPAIAHRGERNGETYPVQDDAHWLERYQQLWSQYRDRVIGTQELVAIVLAEKDHWEQDLTQVPGLVEQVANDLDAILEKGMREAVRPLC